ncbi:DNA helicase mcm9 [Gonapodya sp. JEL0774]|nr:DNA helicase mcm9 [Gonapodya sp. JEL0774]
MQSVRRAPTDENKASRFSGSSSGYRGKGKSGYTSSNRSPEEAIPSREREVRREQERLAAEKCEEWTRKLSAAIAKLCRPQLVAILQDLDPTTHYPLYISTSALHQEDPELSQELFFDNPKGFRERMHVMDDAAQQAQYTLHETLSRTEEKVYFIMKEHVHLRLNEWVRVSGIPTSRDQYQITLRCVRLFDRHSRSPTIIDPRPSFHTLRDPSVYLTTLPRASNLGTLFSLRGTVVRAGLAKVLEYEHIFECNKCHGIFRVKADREEYHVVKRPARCGVEEGDQSCDGTKFKQIEQKDRPTKDYQEVKVG